ncbi:LLM class flavin-dependent oxidoreductase [Mycetocola tolaasinivorans]|uniref:LLM class flavin-dependent oxidoreductase n=1 Tax=Mycetocola tolaasinivorans TaxID=76635 RepID=A0A3L7A279_9MICO|nr:NtaA/DmoA family FMN-dependent monooxygenase [Mycetocola tolaasinivorans]RLP74085.1 LLM class flavin-dependent oxidoreductase [Mycetocola tolaasinivorans]
MTTPQKPLVFGVYEQAAVGLGGVPSLWTHPEDERLGIDRLPFWQNMTTIAEQANLDVFFFGDVLGLYDIYGGGHESAVEWAVEAPANDPLLYVAALAAQTKNLAYGLTASTTYEHPFAFARRLSTLDHLSEGRIGWNIVTSYLENAARNFGLDGQIKHDDRYDRAEEFLDVVYKLWEGSWADDAIIADKAALRYADGSRVRRIDHEGAVYRVQGPHLTSPTPQRTPFLFQAGWSPRGKAFAAKHAEMVFVGNGDPEAVRTGLIDINTQARALGREENAVQSLSVMRLVVGRTEIEAQEKYDLLQSNYHLEAQLVSYAGDTGIDLSQYADHEPLGSHSEGFASNVRNHGKSATPITAGELRAQFSSVTRGQGTTFVGTPEQVADQIEQRAAYTGTTGFMLTQFISPGSLEDFTTLVVPELIKRGLYREDAPTGTLRSRLRADGSSRLDPGHHAASFRFPAR